MACRTRISRAAAPRTAQAARRRQSVGESGFTLLVLIGIVTAMLIAIGAALPLWRGIVQREKEAELISRGFQYAEAIRVFQNRQGRLPNQLEELVEVEPRSIRRLWTDPMTGGSFLLLMEVPGGTVVPIDPKTGEVVAPPPPPGAEGADPGDAPQPFGQPPGKPPTVPQPNFGGDGAPVAGPIHGVKSRGSGEAYRTLFDQKDYGNWEFTVERLTAATQGTGPLGLPRRTEYETLGKPFRYPPPGGVPGANPQAQPNKRQRGPGAPPPGQQPTEPPPENDGGQDVQ